MAQRAGQAGTEAAGALDAGTTDVAALLGPLDQRPQAGPRRREGRGRDETPEQIDEHNSMRVSMSVDAEDDLDGQAWHRRQGDSFFSE